MKTLVVLLGPTGVGKTDLSIRLAKKFNAEIVSSDSRQVFKELQIGTAVPTDGQLKEVRHHLIQHISVHDYYNVSMYEQEVLQCLNQLFLTANTAFLVGGSAMYIDVVCNGIDDIPDGNLNLRSDLKQEYEAYGIEHIRAKLKLLDPVFYEQVDLMNPKRMLKALEVCIQTGKPYSSFRKKYKAERNFNLIKIGLKRDRAELYERINKRVDQMLIDGLIEEAKRVNEVRHLNSLNTVGYKELFSYFNGEITETQAIELIKRNSRRFAKRQLTWWAKDHTINWFHPDQGNEIIEFLNNRL